MRSLAELRTFEERETQSNVVVAGVAVGMELLAGREDNPASSYGPAPSYSVAREVRFRSPSADAA